MGNIIGTVDKVITNSDVTFFPIPGTGKVTFTQWWAGTQKVANSSMKFALYWDKWGVADKTKWHLIDVIYTKKGSYQVDLTQNQILKNLDFEATGKSRLVLSSWAFGKPVKREIFARVEASM